MSVFSTQKGAFNEVNSIVPAMAELYKSKGMESKSRARNIQRVGEVILAWNCRIGLLVDEVHLDISVIAWVRSGLDPLKIVGVTSLDIARSLVVHNYCYWRWEQRLWHAWDVFGSRVKSHGQVDILIKSWKLYQTPLFFSHKWTIHSEMMRSLSWILEPPFSWYT